MMRQGALAFALLMCAARAAQACETTAANPCPPLPKPSPVSVESYIGWLPADTVEVAIMPLFASTYYLHLVSFFEDGRPACIDKLAGSLDALLYIERRGNTPATMLLHGHPDRDALERCASEVYKKGGVRFSMKRGGGNITAAKIEKDKVWAGFSNEWVVISTDEKAVEVLMKAMPAASLPPRLLELVHKIGPCKDYCNASIVDYAKPILGVASTGSSIVAELTTAVDNAHMRAVLALSFASPADAATAQARIKALASDKRFSEDARKALAASTSKLAGDTLTIDASPLIAASDEVRLEWVKTLAATGGKVHAPPKEE